MYFRKLSQVLIVGLGAYWLTPVVSYAEVAKYQLSTLPNKCVALRHGRTCFAQVVLRFEVVKPGLYCIRRQNKEQPLYCETISRYGSFKYDFQAKSKQIFTLVEQGKSRILASTTIDVAWVHQVRSRKRRWRLF